MASSSLHLDIALGVFRGRSVIPELHRGILRTHTLLVIMRYPERTCSAVLRCGILARLAITIDLRRQRNDVAHADLCELREVLVTRSAQGEPRPALLVL